MSVAHHIDPVRHHNVAAYLEDMARTQTSRAAVIVPHGRDTAGRVAYTHLTFEQLNAECDAVAHGLVSRGIGRGTRTVLMVKPSLDFFAITFALFKIGAVPVLVDPGMGIRNLKTCLAEAEPEAFIGIPKAHLARVLLGWARRSLKHKLVVGAFPGVTSVHSIKKPGHSFELADTTPEDTAAILFTSGSTGPPKGAIYTHATFSAQVEILRETFDIQPGEIDLATFPLFALFGPALGMTVLIPDMDASRPGDADPVKLIEAIQDFGATNMFGSPALLDRIGRYGVAHGTRLPSLRRVMSAGAPASIPILERMTKLLSPDTPIYTPYGATEALPVAITDSRELLHETRHATESGRGICVGKPVGGIDVKVIRITDEPIETLTDDLLVAAGEMGEFAVSGKVVTQGYWNRPASNRSHKMKRGDRLYHRMGDVGYIDAQGRLWFCGRKSHRVQTKNETLFTIQVEAVFNTDPAVRRTALVGVGGQPILCVELETTEAWDTVRARLRALAQTQAHTGSVQTFLRHQGFPVDTRHNAKIFREKLSVWAQRQLGGTPK